MNINSSSINLKPSDINSFRVSNEYMNSMFTTNNLNQRFNQICPPRKGTPISFGFGSSIVITNNVSKIFNIKNIFIENKKIPNTYKYLKRLDFKKNESIQFDLSEINNFLISQKKEIFFLQPNSLQIFRNNCFFELLLLSLSRGYLINNFTEYDTLFECIRSNINFNVWNCYCEANGKPTNLISKRSILGFYCGTIGISKTLEMYKEKRFSLNGLIDLEISWGDRFALSVLCGERELSSCYLDYSKSGNKYEDYSGIKCICFENILNLIYLSFSQKIEHFEINRQFLELWPHYIYPVASILGISHPSTKNVLKLISNCLLSEIRTQNFKNNLNEMIFSWQFCQVLLGEYQEINYGININNVVTYITCMDIITLFLVKSGRWNSVLISNEHSLLYRFWLSLYFSDIGDYERANFYIDMISSLCDENNSFKEKVKKEIIFLKARIQENNINLHEKNLSNKSNSNNLNEKSQIQSTVASKNSSWLVGWISSNIKKAIGSEEERWPGVENTFYYDNEIKQWCQKGSEGQIITSQLTKGNTDFEFSSETKFFKNNSQVNAELKECKQTLPPPPSKQSFTSSNSSSNYSGSIGSGGIRTRYVDIFREKK